MIDTYIAWCLWKGLRSTRDNELRRRFCVTSTRNCSLTYILRRSHGARVTFRVLFNSRGRPFISVLFIMLFKLLAWIGKPTFHTESIITILCLSWVISVYVSTTILAKRKYSLERKSSICFNINENKYNWVIYF